MRASLAVALAACVLVGAVSRADAQPADAPANRVLVMPFENLTRDATAFWLGEASAVLLADNLNALGRNPITRDERQQAFERLQVPASAVLTDATVVRIGQLVGATQVIVGSLRLDNTNLVVRARSIELEPGRVQADVTERGPMSELADMFDRVSRRIVAGRAASTLPDRERPPLAAFENYIKGLLADTPALAIAAQTTALNLFPSYDLARLALWDAHVEAGDQQRALTVVQAVPETSPLSARARFLSGLSNLSLRRYDDAFAVFRALEMRQSTPTVLNNLGVVQLQRGGTPQTGGTATYYFDKAAQADPDDPDYVFNLGYAYWQERDATAAVYWLREAVRRNPADGAAHFVLGAALALAGSVSESAREKELAKRLSSTYEQWEKRPLAEQVPKGLERVKTGVELPHARRLETRVTATGQREQSELATFYLDRARRLFQQESDREAAVELDRALYLSPYLAEAHLLLGRIHLRNGRLREAIDALKISVWSADTAEAHAVLGRAYLESKDIDQARAEAARSAALNPTLAETEQLLDMLKSR